ncbi:MAG TPA: hypothetical protein VN578_08575 [Candidatus Binatia bacterium]|nr:hypothetical protein [Candidatus Binatia bacterium]
MALAVLGLAGLTWCRAQTQGRGESPQSSDTHSRTNSNSVGGRNSLQQLEDALSKSFQSFSPGNTAESLTPPTFYPPPRPVTPSPRLRERRKDLLSLSVEELLMPDAPGEDNFKLPGNKNELSGKKSFWEQYYEDLTRPRTDPSKAGAAKEKNLRSGRKTASSSLEPEYKDDPDLPSGIRENEKKLKDLLAEQTGVRTLDLPIPSRTTFADFFGLGEKTVSPEDQKAHKEYMEKYRQLLGANSIPPPSPLNPLNPFGPADPSLHLAPNGGLGGFPGAFGQAATSGNPAGMDALLHPGALPDINARVLNQWNPFYVAPKFEPPKPAPLVVPTVQAPKRVF